MPATRLEPNAGARSKGRLDVASEGPLVDVAEAVVALMNVLGGFVLLADEGEADVKGWAGWIAPETAYDAWPIHRGLGEEPFVVSDAALDPRFADPEVRFYAGVPIVLHGRAVGVVGALDRVPRRLAPREARGLAALARQVAALVEARRAVEKAQSGEAMLRAAAEAGFDTYFLLSPLRDAQGTVVDFRFEFLNAQAAHFFGVESARLVGKPLLETFPTDNVRRFLPVFVRVLETGETFETEYVSQMPAMRDRWARMKIANAGDLLAITGQDIHERREAQEALAATQARLAATFDAVQVGIMVVSPEGDLLRANPEAERALGIEAGKTRFAGARLDFETFNLDGSPLDPAERPVAGALQGIDVRGKLMRLRWLDGRERCLHANAVPLRREGETTPYAAVCSFLDVTVEMEQRRLLDERIAETAETNILLEAQRYELERANERLEALATTDGLTGLLNHRAFQELLEGAVRQAGRTGKPLSLLLLDVDRFKALNDEFGHPAGDAVLKGVARVLTHAGRAGEVVARYGGEEFVVVLPDTGPAEAVLAAERLRRAIEAAPWPDRPVTASFGAATIGPGMGRPDLIRAADEALYASKRGGRNRTTHANAEVTA